MATDNKIQAIQGLRFLFAMGVVLMHFFRVEDNWTTCQFGGNVGVVFFFILSGYLSVNSNTSDICAYYKKKFWRIYPIHWFALFLMLGIKLTNPHYWTIDTIWQVGLHFTLLQAFYPNTDVCYLFSGPSWFLSALLFFYLLLPLFQKIRTNHTKIFYLITFISCIVSFAITCVTKDKGWDLSMWGSYVFPLVRLPECLLGMCLYDVSKRMRWHVSTIGELCALLFLIVTRCCANLIPGVFLHVYWWIPALMIVVYVGANSDGALCKLLSSKLLMGGGKISMEIYLFHTIGIVIMQFLSKYLVIKSAWLDFGIVVTVTVLLILIWHYVVELRVEALRKKIN